MIDVKSAQSGWKSFEIVHKDNDGNPNEFPISQVDQAARRRMKLVEDKGWPEAKTLKQSSGKNRIISKRDGLWLLKCTPNQWRLYFYVDEKNKRIIYTHAIYKKTDAEDPKDEARARSAYARLGQRRSAIQEFDFPKY